MNTFFYHITILSVSLLMLISGFKVSAQIHKNHSNNPWECHIIDSSSRGADGVRLADVNKDGLPDITTGWEEGGITRAYIHPGYNKATAKWPSVTVGKTPAVEDAVFFDLDQNGSTDIISCCEDTVQSIFVHWAPRRSGQYLREELWKSDIIPVSRNKTAWMFSLPMEVDEKNGTDLIVGSKGKNALVGWLQAPDKKKNLSEWNFYRLYKAGWIMSLTKADIDEDGDNDIIISDRKGENSGVLWLENPDPKGANKHWREHRIGASGREVMFLDVADLDQDGHQDVIAAIKPDEIHWFRRPSNPEKSWFKQVIKVSHPKGTGTAKGVRVGDINGDGKRDIVYSCEHAYSPKRGVVWLNKQATSGKNEWQINDISGPKGIKYDRIELLDMDDDGDLDVLTCEERTGLGVFWYENPLNE